jgi:hypothetical protein
MSTTRFGGYVELWCICGASVPVATLPLKFSAVHGPREGGMSGTPRGAILVRMRDEELRPSNREVETRIKPEFL